ncbi:YybH family protein [Sphingorhabdus sp. Alg231-15]|uniref:YybH family protein n=1 Tax=Sphingorhabdus sp. Alg231-15 TaxID=1922222 RepID=UPI00307BA6F3
MIKTAILVSAIFALSIPASSTWAAETHAQTKSTDEQKIARWSTRWKQYFEAGDTEQLREMYESDAVLMTHGTPAVRGVEAILTFLGRNTKAGNKVRIDFANEEILIDGNRGYLTAKYWMTIERSEGDPVEVKGRSFLVFKKGSNGAWRLWRDMDNQAPDVLTEERPAN